MSDDPTQANTSKYARPDHVQNLSNDQIVAALLRLTMEISVVRDRLATCESLLHEHGIFDADAIDQYKASPGETADRTAARFALIEKLISDLS